MEEHRVTICVPAYNAEKTIRASLDSILAQSFTDFDLIIADDCSTDHTPDIIAEYKDPRIQYIRHKKNKGGSDNWDFCIQAGRGEYTTIFHADDIYEPEILEQEVTFLDRHEDAGAVFTMAYRIDEKDNRLGDYFMPSEFLGDAAWDKVYSFEDIFKGLLKYFNFLLSSNVLVRTPIYQNHVRTYNYSKFGVSGDLWMWLHILEKYKIGILPSALMGWRSSPTQWSSRDKNLISHRHPFFDVIHHYLSQPWVSDFLSPEDYRNLDLLEMTDRYTRGINCIVKENVKDAREILKGAWDPGLLWKVLSYSPPWEPSRYYKWWGIGIVLNVISKFPKAIWPKKFLFKLLYKS